jgi:large subunit ribosomal protein L25
MATELDVAPRTVVGKKTAALRRGGETPANIYGHKVDSTAVQADTVALTRLLRASSRNQIINLNVAGEGKPRTVVVRDIARNPVTGQILHIDFYQVSMTEKMKAEVPVVIIGTSEAVTTFGGVLMQLIDAIAVEALPGDIPVNFEVDISRITELEQSLHVRDLGIDESKVSVTTDPDVVVARVAAPRLAAELEEEAAAAAAEAAPSEGEAPAEGEAAPAPAEEAES